MCDMKENVQIDDINNVWGLQIQCANNLVLKNEQTQDSVNDTEYFTVFFTLT